MKTMTSPRLSPSSVPVAQKVQPCSLKQASTPRKARKILRWLSQLTAKRKSMAPSCSQTEPPQLITNPWRITLRPTMMCGSWRKTISLWKRPRNWTWNAKATPRKSFRLIRRQQGQVRPCRLYRATEISRGLRRRNSIRSYSSRKVDQLINKNNPPTKPIF
jgi:hypothetical protein